MQGPVTAKTSHAKIEAKRVEGALSLGNSYAPIIAKDILAERVRVITSHAPLTIEMMSDDRVIGTVGDGRGKVDLATKQGSIRLK